jgi:hypothetical protein
MSEPPSSIWRHGPLMRFWLARTATSVAFQMQAVGVGWQLYDLTHNPVDLGLVGILVVAAVWVKMFPALYRVERFPST